MSIGDLIFNLINRDSPQQQLDASMAQQSSAQPETLGQSPQQPAPGYATPPDLFALYTRLQNRQKPIDDINSGIGLMAGAFAQPANKALLARAFMRDGGTSADDFARFAQLNMAAQAQARQQQGLDQLGQSAQAISDKYGIPVEVVKGMVASGNMNGLTDLIVAQQRGTNTTAEWGTYQALNAERTSRGQPPIDYETFVKMKGREAIPHVTNVARMQDGRQLMTFSDGTQKIGDLKVAGKTAQLNTGTEIIVYDTETGQIIQPGAAAPAMPAAPGAPAAALAVPSGATAPAVSATPAAPITGPAGGIPINNEGEAAAREKGKLDQQAVADARKSFEGSVSFLKNHIDHINELINADDKDLGTIVGGMAASTAGKLLAKNTDMGKASVYQSYLDQLTGESWIQGFNRIRGQGAGQITEKEGPKLEASVSRLQNQNLSLAEYKKALTEFRDAMQEALKNTYNRLPKEAQGQFKDVYSSIAPKSAAKQSPEQVDVDALVKRYSQ